MKNLQSLKNAISSDAILNDFNAENIKGGLRLITGDRWKFRQKKRQLRRAGTSFIAAIVKDNKGNILHFCIEW